jgi:hypothetical protein
MLRAELPSPTPTIYFALALSLMAQGRQQRRPAAALRSLHFSGHSMLSRGFRGILPRDTMTSQKSFYRSKAQHSLGNVALLFIPTH